MPVRILVADDNPFVRQMVHRLFEGPDREIIEAENGQQAISMALEQHPQVAVFDLAMPVMDGLTAARRVHDERPELPILMYTMHWSSQLEIEAIKAGIRRVIAKSDNTSLVAAVTELVDAARQAAAPTPPATEIAVLAASSDPLAALPAIDPQSIAAVNAIAAEPPASDAVVADDSKEPLS